MTAKTTNHLLFDFDPRLPERFASLREYLFFLAQTQPKPLKSIAADMDMSPSALGRKLNPSENDCQRFNVDDLEAMCAACGPELAHAAITYIASKYCDSPDERKQRALNEFIALMQQASALLPQLQDEGG